MKSHVRLHRTRGAARQRRGRAKSFSLALLALSVVVASNGTLAGFFRSFAAHAAGGAATLQAGFLIAVNSTGDGDNAVAAPNCDADLGTPGDQCTLRAAIQAANSSPGDDAIVFALPTTDPGFDTATGRHTINLTRALPNLSTSVSIAGPGADKLTVRRDTGGNYRIFTVTATGTVTLSGMTISNGSAVGSVVDLTGVGGGIRKTNAGTVNVVNCVISDNFAFVGGGIANSSSLATLNITNTTISNNTADGNGGGITNSGGTTNVTNSTISRNIAISNGGGIANIGTTNVTNSTISDNIAGTNGGGIIAGLDNGDFTLTNSTISKNFAGSDGGGISGGGSTAFPNAIPQVKSSIIALNQARDIGPDVQNAFTSFGFNVIGKTNGSTGFTQPTDQTGSTSSPLDPKLDPDGLQNNGGPTKTIALLPSSPAIDKGTAIGLTGPLTTDQRGTGFARTFDDPAVTNAVGGDGTDVGAFEAQPGPTPTPTPTPTPAPTCTPAPTPEMQPDGVGLAAESCPPANSAVDPGERVTLNLTLTNNGNAPTSDLVGTLQSSAHVIAPSGPQSYGAMSPGGTASGAFSFTADGAAGQTIPLTLHLQDGNNQLGTATFNLTLGSDTSCRIPRLVVSATVARVNPSTVQAAYTVQNIGAISAHNIELTTATLGTTSGTPLPQLLGDLAPGATSPQLTVNFSNSTPGASLLLKLNGSYTGGSFGSTRRTTVP